MKILTSENVMEYQRKGLKQIVLEERPILTDLAREAMQTYGISLVIGKGAAPAAAPAAAAKAPAAGGAQQGKSQGGGLYGAGGAVGGNSEYPTAQLLTRPTLNKKPFREVMNSKKILGTFLGTPHPVMTEFVGHLGLDFVCIDAEHNAMHLETVQKMLQGLTATPTYGVVRVPTNSYEYVSGALDIGADALLIPQIRTMDDIERLRQYSQYPPIGIRGCGPSRLWDYGDGIGQLGGVKDTNGTTNIIVQIETVKALEIIDQLVQVDFIDMFFIGPGDLSMDMGIFGQMQNPRLVDAITMVREKTARAGKKLGIFAGNFEVAKSWYAKGFDMVIVNSELAIMSGAISAGVKTVRDAIGE